MDKRNLAKLPLVRPLAIWALKHASRDFKTSNPWTGDSILLNAFKHKGYWFYGKQREFCTMDMFSKLINEGDIVFEAGGHIGFITQYFSALVGLSGRIIVFEPGTNNLPYIGENIKGKDNVLLERLAISDEVGKAGFFEDNISGQNNSLLSNYSRAESVASSHNIRLKKHCYEVPLTTIDRYVDDNSVVPNFIKIDIEGNEYKALLGARDTLPVVKSLMVEVTENHKEVWKLLREFDFTLYNDKGMKLDESDFGGNVFALR